MKRLTQRALRVSAVLEYCRQGSADILDSLLPFFQPLLEERNGKLFDPTTFSEEVAETYGWNFNADVAEELIPRFKDCGWLVEAVKPKANGGYVVTCESNHSEPTQVEVEINEALSSLIDGFLKFIGEISPLSAYVRTKEELSDIYVEWLVSVDAFDETVLDKKFTQVEKAGTLSVYHELPQGHNLSSEDGYMCARYTQHLFDTNSPFVADLCRLASVGLLTEVVRDFHKPTSRVEKTDLVLYLDGPVALDFLGVSGGKAKANIQPMIQGLQAIGCSVRAFEVTLEEMSRVLKSTLDQPPPERVGPTADAIRRNEADEAYVRDVARDPKKYLEGQGVQVVQRRLDAYPNEHPYFDDEAIKNCMAQMQWQSEIRPREHDASVMALIMRLRRGRESRDIFGSKVLLVTRNGPLAQMSRRFCVQSELCRPTAMPPIVHQRQLATALWLRTGNNLSFEDVPRRYLLAACEKVLELKRPLLDKVRAAARSLTPEKAAQMDALLTHDRSTQLLLDKTLGSSKVIGEGNIAELLDEMKQELAAEEREKSEERERQIRQEINQRLITERARGEQLEREYESSRAEIGEREREDGAIVEKALNRVNRWAKHAKIAIYVILYLLLGVFATSQVIGPYLSGALQVLVILVTVVVAFTLAVMQINNCPHGVASLVAVLAKWRLEKVVSEWGIGAKLERFHVEWEKREQRFVMKPVPMPEEEYLGEIVLAPDKARL